MLRLKAALPILHSCVAARALLDPSLPTLFVLVRDELGISQKALALRLRITRGNLSRIENGTQKPGPEILAALARASDVLLRKKKRKK